MILYLVPRQTTKTKMINFSNDPALKKSYLVLVLYPHENNKINLNSKYIECEKQIM
jgi:hypothetical protein